MHFDKKATCRFLKRRHKLYKLITNHVHTANMASATQIQTSPNHEPIIERDILKSAFIATASLLESQNLDIFTFLQTLKPIKSSLLNYSKQFLTNILLATHFQSGRKLAYILYRLCRDNPEIFRKFNSIIKSFLIQKARQGTQMTIEQCIFFTDLFFYGFYLTAKGYIERILPHCEKFIVDFVARTPPINEWSVFVPKKYMFKLKNQCENWINDLIKATKDQHKQLKDLQQKIKQLIVKRKKNKQIQDDANQEQNERQKLNNQYTQLYQKYEENRQKLEYIQRSHDLTTAKELFMLEQQCAYYDPTFTLPVLLHNLYNEPSLPKLQITRIKPSQMLSLFDDEAFIGQLRLCGSIQKAVDLASYFVANLSTQRNRQELIQFVIDYCHNESNLDLIMKIIAEINSLYPEIGDYLSKKAYKIASQLKMNKKYLPLICQSTKQKMIASNIILSYIQRRLLSQHTEVNILQTIRQSSHILQVLGQGIYHQSLGINIKVNQLLQLMQQKIAQKKLGLQFVFQLKCVKNYLRRAHALGEAIQNADIVRDEQTLSELVGEFNLNQHYDLILKRIKQLLHHHNSNNKSSTTTTTSQQYNKTRVLNYLSNLIDHDTNFIETFLQASLIKEINNKQLMEQITNRTVEKIQLSLTKNIQQAVKWSRFLGELYNYQIINRKQLATILQTKLLYSHQLSSVECFEQLAKCILQCLNISKSYILESQLNKENNHYIMHFVVKFKRAIVKYLEVKQLKGRFDNVMIEQQLGDLLEWFHPVLVKRFKTTEEIDLWLQKVKFSSPKDTPLAVNLYKMLHLYQQTENINTFDPTSNIGQKKYHKPAQNIVKTNKKLLYKQKPLHQQPPHTSSKPSTSIQSIEKQIEQINQNLRNQQTTQITQQQKQLIKEQQHQLQQTLKQMMGITPQIELDQKFPQLNQKNLKSTKNNPNENVINMKKILKNPNGKKIKIIARKNHPSSLLNQQAN